MERLLHRNITNIYLMVFFQSAMLVTAVFVPLMQRYGLSMAQVLQTQALFALVVAIAEVPSGYLADKWGRKNTIISGALLCVVAFSWLALADSFADFLVYELLMGIGISLNSGADLALLYDSQNQLNQSQSAASGGQHIARLVTIESVAGGLAALLTGILTHWSLDWVLWIQCVISMLALWFALNLVEAPRQISSARHRDSIKQCQQAITASPMVLWTSAAIIIVGLAALFAFWLSQKYWQSQAIPLTWFGYIWALHCLVRSISAFYATDLERLLGAKIIVLMAGLLPLIGFLGMGLLGGYLGVCLGLAFPLGRGLSTVVFYDALNKRIGAEYRATVNSLVSLGTRGLFIIGAPLLGYLIDSKGVDFTLLILAGLFAPLFAMILLPLTKLVGHEQKQSLAMIKEVT